MYATLTVISFTYLLVPVGNRLRTTDGSGVATSYTYDALDELLSVTEDTKRTSLRQNNNIAVG